MSDRAELARTLERVEREAWRDLWSSAPAPAAHALGLSMRDVGGGLALVATAIDSLLFNRVIGLGLDAPAERDDVRSLAPTYRGSSGFAINLSPFAAPATLEDWLREAGMATFFHHRKYARDARPLEQPEAPDVRPCGAGDVDAWRLVRREVHGAAGGERGEAWSGAEIGRPGWRHFLAWDGAEPMAIAAVFVRDGAAWLGAAMTRPAFRRRGAQRALIAARVRAAIDAGARVLTTETAPAWDDLPGESRRNVERAGFELLYERPSWIVPPSS